MANVFISHSSADKARFVLPLVRSLRDHHHAVWYDNDSIDVGDSIPLKISEGLEDSEYAVLVISPSFLESSWCTRELAAIIMGHTNRTKRLIVVRLQGARVPEVIADILRFELESTERTAVDSCIVRILQYLDEATPGASEPAATLTSAGPEIVKTLLQAEQDQRFDRDLLPATRTQDRTTPENEGLILIKPGGTFHERCLQELFKRITKRCRVRQVRLFNGPRVYKRKLFDRQYETGVRLATGEIPLTEEDLQKIRNVYDSPQFLRTYGVPYSNDLVVPALTLTRDATLDPRKLSELWEEGRKPGIFHNNKANGLNKIGYQKSVFPIRLPRGDVRIVLNGYIPGYHSLFTWDEARVVAIHATTGEPWQLIRDQVVGGESDPNACTPGSIRKDAANGLIPLDPADNLVNGQRNVCHSSATLLDGMRELCLWFKYEPEDTVLGQVWELAGLELEMLLDKYSGKDLPTFSWFTRDDNLAEVLFEVRFRVAKDELRGDVGSRARVADYGRRIDAKRERDLRHRLRQDPALNDFIDDGRRLTVGGEELYLHTVARALETRDDRATFLEVARRIHSIADDRPAPGGGEVLAAAYRIAAGDLMWLKCPAYESVYSPEIFRATVIGELAEQAYECALRTESNLIRDLRAKYSGANSGHAGESVSIEEDPSWDEYLRQRAVVTTDTPIAAIILCGGRSTRMASTIPKPILPLRNTLLVIHIHEAIRRATKNKVEIFAAVGFRKDLIQKAIGDRMRYLSYHKTLGLGFRMATALEMLSPHEGLVIVAYADTPDISLTTIEQLLDSVTDPRTFGLVESQSDVSGHIIRRNGRIQRIVQSRLEQPVSEVDFRDVGLYAFHNTSEFRSILRSIRNDNFRGEYMFADVVGRLVDAGWQVVAVPEQPEFAHGINTPSELLSVACGIKGPGEARGELATMLQILSSDYLLDKLEFDKMGAFRRAVTDHRGPVHFFQWWDESW